MNSAAHPHRIAWRERLVHFLIPRLLGDEAEKEGALEMVLLAIKQAHDEGVQDCAYIMGQLGKEAIGEQRRAFQIAERALKRLSQLNAKDDPT